MMTNTELMTELLWCLTEFADVWNSGDASKGGKRAEGRRSRMWQRTNAVLSEAEAQGISATRIRAIAKGCPK